MKLFFGIMLIECLNGPRLSGIANEQRIRFYFRNYGLSPFYKIFGQNYFLIIIKILKQTMISQTNIVTALI